MKKIEIPAKSIVCETLECYTHDGAFLACVSALKEEGSDLFSGEALAEVRIAEQIHLGKCGEFCNTVFLIAENPNYMPDGDILFADRRYNPYLKKTAFDYRDNYNLDLDETVAGELRERAEKDPIKAIKSGVLLLPRSEVRREIPSSAFSEEPLTIFVFREFAQEYGLLLQNERILSVPITVESADYAKSHTKPFGRLSFIQGLNINSEIYCLVHELVADNILVGGLRRVLMGREPVQHLESNIQQALNEGVAFKYNGKLYVPVNEDAIKNTK